MSKTVITDLVLPIIVKQLELMGHSVPTYADIQDETLLEYFEQELNKERGPKRKVELGSWLIELEPNLWLIKTSKNSK